MKRNIFLVLGLCSTLLITGCENPLNKEGGIFGSDYSSYEIHHYDADFKHTEEIEAKYDKKGNLKKLEMYMIYNEKADQSDCDIWERRYSDAVDLKYDGVEVGCDITNKGVKIYYIMTDKSLADGYLKNEEDYRLDFEDMYEYFETAEKAKKTVEMYIEEYKENGIEYNDQNYVVIDGVKTGW